MKNWSHRVMSPQYTAQGLGPRFMQLDSLSPLQVPSKAFNGSSNMSCHSLSVSKKTTWPFLPTVEIAGVFLCVSNMTENKDTPTLYPIASAPFLSSGSCSSTITLGKINMQGIIILLATLEAFFMWFYSPAKSGNML